MVEEKIMEVKTSERNKQMQQDREAGMSIKEIAEKYGVSEARVSTLTQGVKTIALKPISKKRGKESWPEWELWRNLNKRYGKKAVKS